MEILGTRYARTSSVEFAPVVHNSTDRSLVTGHSKPKNRRRRCFASLSWVTFLFSEPNPRAPLDHR